MLQLFCKMKVMRDMLKKLVVIFFIVTGGTVTAQISHGGEPATLTGKPEVTQLELVRQPMAFSDQISEQGKLPLRFAEPIYTNFTPQNSGTWEQQGSVFIWRLAIKSAGAKSLNIIFDRFYLEHGDRLFAYNPDKTHVLGAFTNENNNPSKLFAIAPIVGDEIILELQTPRHPDAGHELLISAVNHDYLGVADYVKRAIDFGDSGSCNVNAVCGTINSKEINRSVCKVIVDGSMLCSGTLVNNTAQNGKPYFLTAAHCFDDYSNIPESLGPQNIIFYFNFDSPVCEPSTIGPVDQTISGADVKAFVEDMDFALLELSKMPPESYSPYWAGWSREQAVTGKVFGVHHPWGDVKKVSVTTGAPLSTTFVHTKPGGVTFRSDCHWKVDEWESGVTEGGSSGSGLFTEEQLLIGSLSGGEAYCGNPYNDYYARINKAWDLNPNTNEQLAFWLDNGGTDVLKFEGLDYYSNKAVLSHFNEGDEKVLYYDESFLGSWSGHNSLGYEGYAEYYNDLPASKIAGIYISPAKVEANNVGQTFNIKIWDALNNKPNSVLRSIEQIPLNRMSGAKQLYTFDEPLEINEPIFVGVELNYVPEPIDTLAIYQVKPVGSQPAKNTAFIRSSGSWSAYNDLHPLGNNGSYLIELLVYKDYLPTDTGDVDKDKLAVKVLNNPIRNQLVEFTSNIDDLTVAEVYALNGQLMHIHSIQNPLRDSFWVAGLPNGIYLLKFKSSKASVVRKVLILN
jgi:hypothetical protein